MCTESLTDLISSYKLEKKKPFICKVCVSQQMPKVIFICISKYHNESQKIYFIVKCLLQCTD